MIPGRGTSTSRDSVRVNAPVHEAHAEPQCPSCSVSALGWATACSEMLALPEHPGLFQQGSYNMIARDGASICKGRQSLRSPC